MSGTLPDKCMTLEDVAQYASVSVRTVWRDIRDDKLRVIKVRNATRCTPEAVQAWLDNCRPQPLDLTERPARARRAKQPAATP